MDKIKIQDIDFSLLNKMIYQGGKSIIYEDDDTCYKILNDLYPDEREALYRKLLDIDGIKIDNVYFPQKLIIQGDQLVGFTLDKFKNSMPVYDKFNCRFIDFNELFSYITKACTILQNLHQNDIICQDLSFDNILVDKEGNIAFCDMDGCSYKGYNSPFISMPMMKLICEYRKENFMISKNFDKLSMLVSLYYLIYFKYLHRVSKWRFDVLANNVETIANTMIYIQDLLNIKKEISEIPYLDELIVPSDHYIMDRQKEFSLLRKILKR